MLGMIIAAVVSCTYSQSNVCEKYSWEGTSPDQLIAKNPPCTPERCGTPPPPPDYSTWG